MTQDRRITDKLPGHPLQWDDAASTSAAPAAGQAGLAKLQRFEPATHAADVGEMIDCADGQYVLFGDVCALLAAPVAADTEQARDAVRYRWLRNQQSWGTVVYEAIGYGAGEDFDKAIDAAMGFTPGEISPALHSDDALRKTEGYRLGYMEGVARKQVDILEIANERRAVELTAERMADNLSEEEKAALDRLDKPEWRAASNLKLRALLAVEVANCIRMGAKIENLQDELRATEGYRRGYTDGAADAAGIADVQSDWRGIWDEGPLQGEAVLATNGKAVIAARWFATGWAKHDHFSEEVEYLPEGWVTHWKPMPAAGSTAPLATPADAGAGLTPQRISELWMSLTHIDRYNRVEPFARAIEREVLARLSTSGAPVTACGALVDTLTAYLRREMPAGTVICRPDWWAMKIARAISTGSPAPVTAEPAATYFHKDIDSIADELEADAMNYEGDFADTVKGCVEALRDIATHSAPADRDAIRADALEEAARVCYDKYSARAAQGFPREASTARALRDEIIALKSIERAADAAETRDAKGGDHA